MAGRMRDAAHGSAAAAPLHQGWLMMAAAHAKPNQLRRMWHRRYFVLSSAGVLSYHVGKVRPATSEAITEPL